MERRRVALRPGEAQAPSVDQWEWLDHPAQLPDELHPTVYRMLCTRPPCVLCAMPIYTIKVCLLKDPRAWGLEPGSRYGRCVPLCLACARRQDYQARVVAVLWTERHAVRLRDKARWN
jgi:hypothetical protein